ncbi:hypothetical protein [Nocardioides rubriscoriae]|uniref:hypothetical protein n=1 Tax=Nocardioides rubriscoriae TaxID=642762 RepID=UPI0011DF922C|nr:hypothetical protein [Nocardioides rubriscoriae]
MKTLLLAALCFGALTWAGTAGTAGASAGAVARAATRPVVVDVEGDKADGFTLHYADGSSLSPPTDSEAAAECSEYDTRLARVRCRVGVRTWYRDLGDLQRSLAWVRAHR